MKQRPFGQSAICSGNMFYALLALCIIFPGVSKATTVTMETTLGNINIQLFDSAAPVTVANFLNYVQSGAYVNSFIHRSVPGFVVQGGGYSYDPSLGPFSTSTAQHIAVNPSIINEFDPSRSNIRGTIAMAKLGGNPDSATSEWFFNLADNSANLDFQNGGFTVFGQVVGNGMNVIDAIAALNISNQGGPFTSLPVINATGAPIQSADLVTISNISAVPLPGAIWLFITGLFGLVGIAGRKAD